MRRDLSYQRIIQDLRHVNELICNWGNEDNRCLRRYQYLAILSRQQPLVRTSRHKNHVLTCVIQHANDAVTTNNARLTLHSIGWPWSKRKAYND